MRILLIALLLLAPSAPGATLPAAAQQGCTGDDCPPPRGDGNGCEHGRQDSATS